MIRHRYPCIDPPPQIGRLADLGDGHRHACIHDAAHDPVAVEHQCSCGMTWYRTTTPKRARRLRLGRLSVYIEPRDWWVGVYVAPAAVYVCPFTARRTQVGEAGAMTTEHVEYKCNCWRTGCQFCDGGLFACGVCHSFEGATTTHCPGEPMTAEQSDAVYAGTLDYRDGAWREGECSEHTPAWWATPAGRAQIAEARRG